MADPYPFLEDFGRYVAYYACTDASFMARIGNVLEVDRVPGDEAHKLLLRGASLVWRESGVGASKAIVVLQQLRRLVDDGRVTFEELQAAGDALEADEDAPGRPTVEDVLSQVIPIIRKDVQRQAADAADEAWAKDLPLERAERLIQRSRTIGQVDESVGTNVDDAAALIRRVGEMPRMPIGVMDLDEATKGGLRRGCVGLWLGSTGAGKSQALNHVACTGLRMGYRVAYATVGAEVTEADVWARAAANITGTPIDGVFGHPERWIAEMKERTNGKLYVQEFPGSITTVRNLADWKTRLEDKQGAKIDVFVTDYLGKLAASSKGARKSRDESSYKEGGAIVEEMCGWTKEGDFYQWTAEQGQRRKDSKKLLDTDDVADSLHKTRSIDLEISVNFDKETQEVTFLIGKDRHGGGAGTKVGPVPADYVCGRLVVMSSETLRYTDKWLSTLSKPR